MRRFTFPLSLIFASLLCPPALLVAAPAPAPDQPQIPAQMFRVQNNGATLETSAFQKAIADCAQAGGGVIDVPAGRYHTGSLTLGGRTELRLEAGARILFEQDPDAYQTLPKPFRAFLTSTGDDVALTGAGTIDGQGAQWWTRFRHSRATPGATEFQRPRLVAFNNCRRVLVRGVTLVNSPSLKNVRTEIDISSYYPHPPKPGVADPTTKVAADTPCWRNIQIRNVTATGGRDAGLMVGLPEMPLSNITLENVHLSADHGMRIDNARGIHLVNTQITTSDGKPALVGQNADIKW